eukprot:657606-Hanusia_phi.AAC.1
MDRVLFILAFLATWGPITACLANSHRVTKVRSYEQLKLRGGGGERRRIDESDMQFALERCFATLNEGRRTNASREGEEGGGGSRTSRTQTPSLINASFVGDSISRCEEMLGINLNSTYIGECQEDCGCGDRSDGCSGDEDEDEDVSESESEDRAYVISG